MRPTSQQHHAQGSAQRAAARPSGPSRRALLGGLAVGALASTVVTGRDASAATATATNGISWPQGQALPHFAAPQKLDVTDITVLTGDEKLLLGSLQGVVNRTQPRIYLIGDDAKNGEGRTTWLDDIGVRYTMHDDGWDLVAKYRGSVRGVIVYDPDVPDSINVATTLAGLKDAVVAPPALLDKLAKVYGLHVADDLRGRFTSRLDAYTWQFENLWAHTTHRMLIGLSPLKDVGLPPGIPSIYTTLAKVDAHIHDASNRQVYDFDLTNKLGGSAVWVRFDDAFTDDGWGPAVTQVTVKADGAVIADFNPGSDAEEPYLFDADNSQVSAGPPQHRFADNGRYFVYKFVPPAGTQTLSLSVDMWNEYTVSVANTEPARPGKVPYAYLRDYAVANRAMTFWLDPNVTDERDLFEKIMSDVAPYTPYLGWFAQDVAGEFGGTELCSKHGVYVLAADWFENMSVHSGVRAPISNEQLAVPSLPLENKVYVTFTMSEGDNLQYNEHRLRILWGNEGRGSVPINWTTSPLLKDAAPGFLSHYQRTATKNDLLVAGPSGAGYIYPTPWPDETFAAYTRQTGAYMSATGMDVVYVLNRVGGSDVELSASEAAAYAADARPRGLFLNWGGSTHTELTGAGTPLSTIRGVGSVGEARDAIAAARADWDGNSPLFVAIGVLAWNMTPQNVAEVAGGLGPEYAVVRGDQFFDLAKKALAQG